MLSPPVDLPLRSRRHRGRVDAAVPNGTIDGFRIAQDWTVDDDLELWVEADALHADAVAYIDALIRELRACEIVFDIAPSLSMAQRVTIVRHVAVGDEVQAPTTIQEAVAALAMMDAPVLMMVDPWPFPAERSKPEGKLRGRGQK